MKSLNEKYIEDIKDGKIKCYVLEGDTYKNYQKHLTAEHNSDVSRLTLKRLYIQNKKFSIEKLSHNMYWITCRDMSDYQITYLRALAVREIDRKKQERLDISNDIIARVENRGKSRYIRY